MRDVKMAMNDELGCNTSFSVVPPRHLNRGTERNHENLQWGDILVAEGLQIIAPSTNRTFYRLTVGAGIYVNEED
jgi:hypothetical protein